MYAQSLVCWIVSCALLQCTMTQTSTQLLCAATCMSQCVQATNVSQCSNDCQVTTEQTPCQYQQDVYNVPEPVQLRVEADYPTIDSDRLHIVNRDQYDNHTVLVVNAQSIKQPNRTQTRLVLITEFPWSMGKEELCEEYSYQITAVNVAGAAQPSDRLTADLNTTMAQWRQAANVTSVRFECLEQNDNLQMQCKVLVTILAPIASRYPKPLGRLQYKVFRTQGYCPSKSLHRSPTTILDVQANGLATLEFAPTDMHNGCVYALEIESVIDRECNQVYQVTTPIGLIRLNCDTVLNSHLDLQCAKSTQSDPVCLVTDLNYEVEYEKTSSGSYIQDGSVSVRLSWGGLVSSASDATFTEQPLYYAIRIGNGRAAEQPILQTPFAQMLDELAILRTCGLHVQVAACKPTPDQFIVIKDLSYGTYAVMVCGVFNRSHELPSFDSSLNDFKKTQSIIVEVPPPPIEESEWATLALYAVLPCLLLLIVLTSVIFCVVRRMQREKEDIVMEMLHVIDNDYHSSPAHDIWECQRSQLDVYKDQVLGKGAFGVVYKGKLLTLAKAHRNSGSSIASIKGKFENCIVAVKQLPDYATEPDKAKFLSEIALMKQLAQDLGFHEHVVNPLACVTQSTPFCLILEYCSDGNLLDFLRERRNYMIQLDKQNIDYTADNVPDSVDSTRILRTKSLVQFAVNVSFAMEHVSSKGYVHRDLAARNILIHDGRYAKVGDFGMTRKVHESDPQYLDMKNHKVPVKWMAIESLKKGEYSCASDVWAFGVLLFEIMSFGGIPYPNLNPHDVLPYLLAGHRMRTPDSCEQDIYGLMLDCWHEQPENRPGFSEIRQRLAVKFASITEDYNYVPVIDSDADYFTNFYPMIPKSESPNFDWTTLDSSSK